MVAPIFLELMAGGHTRAFAYPLVLAFLYYRIKQEYITTSILLMLQTLIYPMVFFVCVLTYLFTFINIRGYRITFEKSAQKMAYFILAVILSGVFFPLNIFSVIILQ
jgi:uncharacterized membrane protein